MGTILNAEIEEKNRLGRPKTIEDKFGKKIRQMILKHTEKSLPAAVDEIRKVYCGKALKFKHTYLEIS